MVHSTSQPFLSAATPSPSLTPGPSFPTGSSPSLPPGPTPNAGFPHSQSLNNISNLSSIPNSQPAPSPIPHVSTPSAGSTPASHTPYSGSNSFNGRSPNMQSLPPPRKLFQNIKFNDDFNTRKKDPLGNNFKILHLKSCLKIIYLYLKVLSKKTMIDS